MKAKQQSNSPVGCSTPFCRSPEPPLCACGCGQPVKKARNGRYNKFLLGHNSRYDQSNSPAKTGRFQAGKSGNPKGRPQGSRHKASLAVEGMFLDEHERLTEKCISMALDGHFPALKLAIERILPVKKSVAVKLSGMPVINDVKDLPSLTGYILQTISEGELSPADGATLSNVVRNHKEALIVGQLEQRLEQLEQQLTAGQ